MKKPGIPSVTITDTATQQVVSAIKENLEIITGARPQVGELQGLTSSVSTTDITNKINEIINRLNYSGQSVASIPTASLTDLLDVVPTIQNLYPVGSIYINATNPTNPGTLLGFGTWVAFGAGRVMVGFDSGDALFDTAEETGGSKDAIVVSHTHSLSSTTSSAGSHLHSIYGSTSYNELKGVRGTNAAVFAAGAFGINNPGYYQTFTTGNDAISTEGAHTHSLSGNTNTTGSSGANANLQPYITVYMWKRTA